jgi:hypothetical protein
MVNNQILNRQLLEKDEVLADVAKVSNTLTFDDVHSVFEM